MLHVLHVGQGEAAFVRSAGGHTMLVDAGPGGAHSFDAGKQILVPWLKRRGHTKIDTLILTHADSDHVGGTISLVREIDVGEVWVSPHMFGPDFEKIREELWERRIPIRFVHAETKPQTLDTLRIEFLHPPLAPKAGEWPDNDQSLVFRLEIAGTRFLFTGDIERSAEEHLLQRGSALRAEVLKVSHHGSRTSSTPEFLSAVAPREAIISAGWKNRYGHPTDEVLQRLRERQIRVWRGDLRGELQVRVTTRGAKFWPVREGTSRL